MVPLPWSDWRKKRMFFLGGENSPQKRGRRIKTLGSPRPALECWNHHWGMPFGRAGELSVARAVGSDAGGVFGGKKTMRFRHQNDGFFLKPDIQLKNTTTLTTLFLVSLLDFGGCWQWESQLLWWQAAGHAHAKHLKMQDGRCPRHRNITETYKQKKSDDVSTVFFGSNIRKCEGKMCLRSRLLVFFPRTALRWHPSA